MSAYAIACTVTGSWIVCAALVAVPIGRAMRRPEPPPPEVVNWLPFLPLVPQSPRVLPADYAPDTEIERRFNEIVSAA